MNTPKLLDNFEVRTFMSQFINYEELPSWLDDVVRGAVQQARSNTSQGHISKVSLMRMLQSMDEISVENVSLSYNRKRVALGDNPVSDRMCQYICKALRCASQAIQYHIDNHNTNLYEEIVPEIKDDGVHFTPHQKAILRSLAKSGDNEEFVKTFNLFSTI